MPCESWVQLLPLSTSPAGLVAGVAACPLTSLRSSLYGSATMTLLRCWWLRGRFLLELPRKWRGNHILGYVSWCARTWGSLGNPEMGLLGCRMHICSTHCPLKWLSALGLLGKVISISQKRCIMRRKKRQGGTERRFSSTISSHPRVFPVLGASPDRGTEWSRLWSHPGGPGTAFGLLG